MHFKFSLNTLQIIILIVIPVCLALLPSLSTSTSARSRLILALSTVLLYLYLLSHIPLPQEMGPQGPEYLARLLTVGTVILGMLSGYGCVHGAWYVLRRRSLVIPTQGDIDTAESSLKRVQDDLAKARRTAANVRNHLISWLVLICPSRRPTLMLRLRNPGLVVFAHWDWTTRRRKFKAWKPSHHK